MSRNSSGTYSAPSGQPVVSGTPISSTAHNTLVSDIAAEITDSLSRSGKGGMTAPLRTPDGSNTAPTHAFTNDTDTGAYLKAAGNPALVVNGTERQEWTTAGSKVTGNFEATGNAVVGGTLGVTGTATVATVDASGPVQTPRVELDSITADPASPVDGAIWYRSDTDKVKAQINGATANVATEAYADALVAVTDGASGIVVGANYSQTSVALVKVGANLVLYRGTYQASGSVASGTSSTFCTLPAGYRPAGTGVAASAFNFTNNPFLAKPVLVASGTGVVSTNDGVAAGATYIITAVFSI